jgi:aldehyde:ferredoxin oxidoreductase
MPITGTTYSVKPRDEFLAGTSAYTGRILRVDLSNGDLWVDQPDDGFYRKYVGGRNIILHYLLSEMPSNADPLGEENLLIFAPGLLTGTVLPGAGRHAIGGKSPLTGALGSCEAGGWWGAELKRAGFDAVVIRGVAESPVYLWIKDGTVEIRDAAHLWGLVTADVQENIRQALEDQRIRVAQIGPAGENQVRYASIMHDISRAAGRSGLGAVMGSKKLKAIAVRGNASVGLACPEKLQPVRKWVYDNYKTMMAWAVARGTEGSVKPNHDSGATAVNNYRDGVFEGIDKLDGEHLHEYFVQKHDSCYRCPVRCKPIFTHNGEEIQVDEKYGGPEYETIGALGPLCKIEDPVIVAKANELCAAYGLDTISAGGTIAFTMEAREKGLLPKDQQGPIFGDGASVLDSIHKIANRQGLGDWMAEGSARMAEKLDPEAAEMLAVARGQELPLHDPRLKHAMAMGYALSATGADHMHNLNDSFASFPDGDIAVRLEEMNVPAPLPLWGISEHKIEGFYYETAFKNFFDSAVICHFYPFTYQQMADAISAAGGWDITPDEINVIGLRAINMGRLFLLREGFTAQDDALSARAFHRLSDGPIAGKGLTPEELRHWLDVYYQRMGWDHQGCPELTTLRELDLSEFNRNEG